MTIADVIRTVDRMKPNGFSWDQKVEWIAQLEGQIFEEIVSTHENPMHIGQPHIDKNVNPDHKLIAPFPHDKVYQFWLQSMIDLTNMEINKYNNTSTLFNNAYMTFRDYWNRTYMPVERVPFLRFDNHRSHFHKPYDGRPVYSVDDPLNTGGNYHHPHHPGPDHGPERR